MPSVLVVPVYVEVPAGFARAVDTLEFHLRQAGYAFHTGEPQRETLEETKKSLSKETQGVLQSRVDRGVQEGLEASGRQGNS
jgi:hypothetical protein